MRACNLRTRHWCFLKKHLILTYIINFILFAYCVSQLVCEQNTLVLRPIIYYLPVPKAMQSPVLIPVIQRKCIRISECKCIMTWHRLKVLVFWACSLAVWGTEGHSIFCFFVAFFSLKHGSFSFAPEIHCILSYSSVFSLFTIERTANSCFALLDCSIFPAPVMLETHYAYFYFAVFDVWSLFCV